MPNKAKFVKEITVIDPDTKGEVQLAVYKHEGGGMFAMDSSFLDQEARTDDYDRPIISDPFNDIEDEVQENVLLFDDEADFESLDVSEDEDED